MKDVAVNFSGGSPGIAWGNTVSGHQLAAQKVMMNFLTAVGSDKVVPDRGTTLELDAARGEIRSNVSARHVLNFAALDAKNSVQVSETDAYPAAARVLRVIAEIAGSENGRLQTNLVITTRDDAVTGNPITV